MPRCGTPRTPPEVRSSESSAEALRLFIAVPAPEPVRAAAEAEIARLRGLGDVKWVAPENLHLTLKFLGPTPAERVPAIRGELEKTANRFSRSVVSLGGVSAFPNLRRPRIVWLGLEGEVERLTALAAAVEEGMSGLGFPAEERSFRPHLTLGRVRSPRGLAELARALEQRSGREETCREPVLWPATEVHLVRSVLRPGGPEYTPLEILPLVE